MHFLLLLFYPLFLTNALDSMKKTETENHLFIYNNSLVINYRVIGNGNRPLVFLHGFGAANTSWDDIVEAFDKNKFTLYLIDLKGFGLSGKPKDKNYTISTQSDIVKSFIQFLKLDSITLVGHSYGGGVALYIVTEDVVFSKKISNLILIDCAAYQDDIPFFIKYLRTPVLNSLQFILTSDNFRAHYVLNRLFFNPRKISKVILKRYTNDFSQPNTEYSFIMAAKQIIPSDFPILITKYNQIKIKTLIVWGKQDTAIPLHNGIQLQKSIPNSKLSIIDECGHIPQEEQPKETSSLLLNFLND